MTAWTRVKKIAAWLLLNGFWYLMGTLGTIAGIGWAFNVFAFMTWILFLVTTFILFGVWAGHAIGKPIKVETDPAFPHWVDCITDGAMALVLAAFGHWFYATMTIAHIVGYMIFLKDVRPSPEYPGSTTTKPITPA